MDKITMVKKIKLGLEAYKQFVNKEIHYVYKADGVYKEIVLKAKKQEFMHLCGVEYYDPKLKKKVSPNHFYSLVEDNKISAEHLIPKRDGTTVLKLRVIECLNEILTSSIRIVDKQVTFSKFGAAKTLRSSRQIFALALKPEGKRSDKHIPVSLLDLRTTKGDFLKPSYMVDCIYSKSRTEGIHIYHETESYRAHRLELEFMEHEKNKEIEKVDAV
ncbi:PBECR4 domain-containing protein [Psychrobacillus sp. FSL H8-0510]|uniref:PBECR4 domain-containing protein n=1 Tax=Psychrobacillus sp. FSL H8-0510 TaxID=2921394 RepID=UPI0030F663A8